MKKKIALITGGGKNIGYDISCLFLEKGYDVCITGRDEAEIVGIAAELQNKYCNANVKGYALELSDMESIFQLKKNFEKDFSTLDVLVCNAAHLGVDLDIYTTTEKDFDAVFNANVKGNFFLVQQFVPLMQANGKGSIVLMSSVQSKGAVEGRTVYGASKGAINTLNKYLAYDLAPYHIRSNVVIAGAVHTERWDKLSEEIVKARRSNYIVGREAYAREVSNAVFYLADDAAGSTTGSELSVDSGVMVSILPYRDRKNHV